MMNIIKSSILAVFLLFPSGAYSGGIPLPSITPAEKYIIGADNSKAVIALVITIPEHNYIYASPKGPGTGKPLTIRIKKGPSTGSVLIEKPVKYTADPSDGFVWIYKNSVRFFIPYVIDDTKVISITAEGLMCSDSGSCVPFTISADIEAGRHTGQNGKQLPPGLVIFGENNFTAAGSAGDLFNNPFIKNTGNAVPSSEPSGKSFSIPLFHPVFPDEPEMGIFIALLFGFLAGIILNLMPCVLPVISIKIIGLIRHSDNLNTARKNGIMYSAGIIASFFLLAALISFAGYGWGSLFQRSEFIVIIILFLFLMSLSMFGVFTLNIPGFALKIGSSPNNMAADSFIKGMTAALLATPCSGPLLGAVLAWTISQPPLIIFAVFSAIGTGMAVPYLVFAMRPSLSLLIPKPGKWLLYFEKAMALLMAGSVVYFMYVLGIHKIIPVIFMIFSAAAGAFLYGRFGNLSYPRKTRNIARIIFAVLIIVPLILFFRINSARSYPPVTGASFSISTIEENSRNGRISIVNFTADWCPNCKVVEKTVLETPTAQRLIDKTNASFYTADITQSGTEAEALLNSLGSKSIPFLAVFPAGKDFTNPVCLRDLYTKKSFNDAVLKALELSK